jgi:hypothetical protein
VSNPGGVGTNQERHVDEELTDCLIEEEFDEDVAPVELGLGGCLYRTFHICSGRAVGFSVRPLVNSGLC